MQINVDPDTYSSFYSLKQLHQHAAISDNDFLLLLINHVQSCNKQNNTDCEDRQTRLPSIPVRSCPECKFSTNELEILWQHFESFHPGEGSFSCTCGEVYCALPAFLRHYVQCPVAATDLQDLPEDRPSNVSEITSVNGSVNAQETMKDLNEHSQDSLGNGDAASEYYHSYRHPPVSPVAGPSKDKPYGCPKCPKGFKSKSLLEQHMHIHYPPRYRCRWCGHMYRWPPVYYHHKQKCKKRPAYVNDDSSALNVHKNNHIATTEQQLLKTETLMPPLSTFTDFLKSQMPLGNANMLKPFAKMDSMDTSEGMKPSLVCVCSQACSDFPSYLQHISTCPIILSAPKAQDTNAQNIRTPPAEDTGLDLSTPRSNSAADSHDASLPKDKPTSISSGVNGVFSCSHCSKEFNSKLSLKQHINGKHSAQGKYLCPGCGKRYRWGASFYYHKRTCLQFMEYTTQPPSTKQLLATGP